MRPHFWYTFADPSGLVGVGDVPEAFPQRISFRPRIESRPRLATHELAARSGPHPNEGAPRIASPRVRVIRPDDLERVAGSGAARDRFQQYSPESAEPGRW